MGISLAALGVIGGAAKQYNTNVAQERKDEKARMKAEREAQQYTDRLAEQRGYAERMTMANQNLQRSEVNRQTNEAVEALGGWESREAQLYYATKVLKMDEKSAIVAIKNGDVRNKALDQGLPAPYAKYGTPSEETQASPTTVKRVPKDSVDTSGGYVRSINRPVPKAPVDQDMNMKVQANKALQKIIKPAKVQASQEVPKVPSTTPKDAAFYLGDDVNPISVPGVAGKAGNKWGEGKVAVVAEVEFGDAEMNNKYYLRATDALARAKQDGASALTINQLKFTVNAARKAAGGDFDEGSAGDYKVQSSVGKLIADTVHFATQVDNLKADPTVSGKEVYSAEMHLLRLQTELDMENSTGAVPVLQANLQGKAEMVNLIQNSEGLTDAYKKQQIEILEVEMGQINTNINVSLKGRNETVTADELETIKTVQEKFDNLSGGLKLVNAIREAEKSITATETTFAYKSAAGIASLANSLRGVGELVGLIDKGMSHADKRKMLSEKYGINPDNVLQEFEGFGAAGQSRDAEGHALTLGMIAAGVVQQNLGVSKTGSKEVLTLLRGIANPTGGQAASFAGFDALVRLATHGRKEDIEDIVLAGGKKYSPRAKEQLIQVAYEYVGSQPKLDAAIGKLEVDPSTGHIIAYSKDGVKIGKLADSLLKKTNQSSRDYGRSRSSN